MGGSRPGVTRGRRGSSLRRTLVCACVTVLAASAAHASRAAPATDERAPRHYESSACDGEPGSAARNASLLPSAWPSDELQRYLKLNATYGAPSRAGSAGGPLIASTSGALAVHCGLKAMIEGGSAADAVITTALAQVTLVGGSWSSFAGMFYALYYDAGSGRVYALNAGFNTPIEETDPLSIPKAPAPSGRTAMVGGFMAGVQALHDRFGRLPFADLLEPAIHLAESGFEIDPFMAKIIAAKAEVLTRTSEGRAIFTSADGEVYGEGDRFLQAQLAATLRKVSVEGASYMYTGEWGSRFVERVRAEGGKIRPRDMAAYRAEWEEPLSTRYKDFVACTVGYPELGAVQLLEGLNLLELSGIGAAPRYWRAPVYLNRFIQLCRLAYAITYSPAYTPYPEDRQAVEWISPRQRILKETARDLWKRLQDPGWEADLYRELSPGGREEDDEHSGHSDAIVAVDGDGNWAVAVHSINTSLWGSTGIFVDGVSVPDPLSFQQGMAAKAGQGRRFPNVVNPVIVIEKGRPVLGAAAIGNALHECMLQHIVDVLDYRMSPGESLDAPKFWGPLWGGKADDYRMQAIDAGAFPDTVLTEVERMGQPLKELDKGERKKRVSYWVGVAADGGTGSLSGAVSDDFNGIVETKSP
jgi:gamma-glutamyltranspeptidase/glutathione hydrolase